MPRPPPHLESREVWATSLLLERFSPWPGLRPLPPIPLRGSGVTGVIEVLFDVAVIKMFLAAAMSALKTLFIVVHLNNPRYTLIPQPSPCHGHLDEVPASSTSITLIPYSSAISLILLGADIHNTVQGGEDVKYFVVRGVRGGDRRVTRCDIISIMGWDQLIEYLGDVWGEVWDAMLLKLKAAETSTP